MDASSPILVLKATEASRTAARLPFVPLNLSLMPGEFAIIELHDSTAAIDFADLCCGLLTPVRGEVLFLGRDWAALPQEHCAALRGRIGRAHETGAWVRFLDMDTNILLPQLHHTTTDISILRDRAAGLARHFGLPGVPLARPGALSAADLARAGCVRAFLGEPHLVMLETPLQGRFSGLIPPLLNVIAAACDRGAAAIWLTRRDVGHLDASFPATQRLRLTERGLVSVQAAP